MIRRHTLLLLLLVLGPALGLVAYDVNAQPGLVDVLTVSETSDETETWSISLQVLLFMTVLSVLPALLMTMTSFTRIVIVLAILRQGLGTQQTPSNSILIGIALILTAYVMAPVAMEIETQAVRPYVEETISATEALQAGTEPLKNFMLNHTRESDLTLFADLAGRDAVDSPSEVPFTLLLPAYVTSELKAAFTIGFILLIPFLIIDLVVASVLMSVGMVMLSPLIISLPFKIMLFVLVDGWSLVMTVVAGSFLA